VPIEPVGGAIRSNHQFNPWSVAIVCHNLCELFFGVVSMVGLGMWGGIWGFGVSGHFSRVVLRGVSIDGWCLGAFRGPGTSWFFCVSLYNVMFPGDDDWFGRLVPAFCSFFLEFAETIPPDACQ